MTVGNVGGGPLDKAIIDDANVEWLSAAATYDFVQNCVDATVVVETIVKRASAGLVRSRAIRLRVGQKNLDNVDLPVSFWSSSGRQFKSNWYTGDFDKLERDHTISLAFGVKFNKQDIYNIVDRFDVVYEEKPDPLSIGPSSVKAGRAMTYSHPKVAARAVLILQALPEDQIKRMTIEAMKAELAALYLAEDGKAPVDSTLEFAAKQVLDVVCPTD